MIEFVEINMTKLFTVLIDDERLVHIDWFNYFNELEINLSHITKLKILFQTQPAYQKTLWSISI